MDSVSEAIRKLSRAILWTSYLPKPAPGNPFKSGKIKDNRQMAPIFVIRRARPSDMPPILVVERAGFGEWAWDRKLFAEYMDTCGDTLLVAESRGRVVGYAITCITRRLISSRAELVSIAVSPSVRGKGAADALLRSAIRRVRARKVSRIALTVKVTNGRALRFYEKYGFRRIRRVPRYYEDGEDAFWLQLDV